MSARTMIATKRTGKLRLLGSGSAFATAAAMVSLFAAPVAAQPGAGAPPMATAPAAPVRVIDGLPMLPGPDGMQGGPGSVATLRPQRTRVARPIAGEAFVADSGISLDAPILAGRPEMLSDAHAPHAGQRNAAMATTITRPVPEETISAPFLSGVTPTIAARANGTVSAQGSIAVSSGSATIARGASKDQVQVNSPNAIINWTTFDTATLDTTTDFINFLPAGTELEFVGTGTDYTVLNRIFGTPDGSGQYRGIAFSGTVTTRLSDAGPIGGNVWFYSPGGILLSSSAAFNVGSLVLSTSDINAISNPDIDFLGVTQDDSAILIDTGATINALNDGSYIAMVAPRVEQAGTVTVNGSAAYVGAEQAQLTINNGLFDISVGVGSADANGVVHSGTTTGPASQATVNPTNGQIVNADAQAIYMVAVPKNTAITMLVGGNIGYQAASAASVTDNGTIVLSAGADVSATGAVSAPVIGIDQAGAVAGGSIALSDATLTSDTTVFASDSVDLRQSGLNSTSTDYKRLTMGGDGRGDYALDIAAGNAIDIGVSGFATIDIAGDLTLSGSGDAENPVNVSLSAVGPESLPPGDPVIPIPQDANRISVGGNLVIDTTARGRDDFFIFRNNGNTGVGQDAVAGDISVNVSGLAGLFVGGSMELNAWAQGGKGEVQNGSATAGDITFVNDGGTVDIVGALTLDAGTFSAQDGKVGGNGPGLLGSDGTGGNVSLVLNGDPSGGTTSAGAVTIISAGTASSGSDETAAQANTGIAGDVSVQVTGGSHSFDSLGIVAGAEGATSFLADGTRTTGAAQLGAIDIAVSGAQSTLTITGNLSVASLSSGALLAPAPDFNISLLDTNFDPGTGLVQSGGLLVGNDIFIDLQTGNGSETALNQARSANISVDNSNLTVDFFAVSTEASPGGSAFSTFGSGSDYQAGDITVTARNGGSISGRSAFLTASATGADFTGGNGTGGAISLIADNASIGFTQTTSLNASGQGGGSQNPDGSGSPGTGRGGTVRVQVAGANGVMNLNTVRARSDGSVFLDVEGGGAGFVTGDGGTGIAGTVIFDLDGGILNAGNVTVSASGQGGEGGEPVAPAAPLSGGMLAGGAGNFIFEDGLSMEALSAAGLLPGGALAPSTLGVPSGLPKGGKGGDGIGGVVTFNLNGGSAFLSNLDVTATGEGGEGAFGSLFGGFAGGDGGDSIGGTATFNAISGTLDVTGTLSVTADANTENPFAFGNGNGGNGDGVEGGNAGIATAGDAIFNLDGTATITAGDVLISARAFGGRGGDSSATFFGGVPAPGHEAGAGGNATGGNAVFNNISGTLGFGSLTVDAGGTGGEGGSNFGLTIGEAEDRGGAGGAGIGGTATINLNQDDLGDPTYIVRADGVGGAGGDGLESGAGGFARGGTARLNVNNVEVSLNQATISATATGGAGGFSDGEGGNGGAGGDAAGGTAILDVNGVAGIFSSALPVTMNVNAQGGAGADGNSPIFGLAAPGNGGAGGSGTAGLIQIIARDGASASYQDDFSTNAVGFGGTGGNGGSDFAGSLTGDGGDAGDATGGRIELLAQTGGTLDITALSTSVAFNASAFGAAGGNGGTSSFGDLGALGANGDATAGSILVFADGAGSAINFLADAALNARAIALQDTRTNSIGGDATGGAITVEASNGGALSANSFFAMNGNVLGGQGRLSGGNAIGGSASLQLTGATGSFQTILADLTTDGGNALPNNSGTGGVGGDGGSASGGAIDVVVDAASQLTVTALTLDADSTGGLGGAASATGNGGGAGGSASGGDVTVDFDGTIINLTTITQRGGGTGGAGGAGAANSPGGAGGDGTGGTLLLDIAGSGPVLPSLTGVTLDATGRGGIGGAGGAGDMLTGAGTGGTGGAATGGSATFAISGTGASLVFNPAAFSIAADAFGGAGGGGGDNAFGAAAGTGGVGGDAVGGAVVLQANSGTTLDLSSGGAFSLTSNGTGGSGGFGGDTFLSGQPGGSGGNGGTGRGGSPTLRAIGGTILGNDLQLTATGVGGNGGGGGDDGNLTFGASGNGGTGEGGTPLMEILDGSPGIMSFANVDLLANGTGGTGTVAGTALGGLVTIRDLSPDPLGLFSFGSLDVDASGSASIPGGGFLMVGGSGATTIAGDLGVNVAGDITYSFDGDGQVLVGGNAVLDAGGNIAITHTGNAGPVTSIDVAGAFGAQAGGNFTSADGSLIVAGGAATIRAEGAASVADIAGVGLVEISAAQDVDVHNAAVSGAPVTIILGAGTLVAGPQLRIEAGLDALGSYDPAFDATVTGLVTSTGTISVNAGGSALFEAGSSTISDNGLTVQTGDDIIIGAGALVEAAANPATTPNAANPFSGFNNLVLQAGGLDPLTGPLPTPISSIISDGTIDANGFAIIMSANAIDALDGSVIASSISADINDAPSNAAIGLLGQSDDAGLLDANCVQGNVCFGNIEADNQLLIGQASNNDVINLFVEQGTVNANDILITTRNSLVMGTNGIATTLNAANQFSATSIEGDVDLRDASITSDSILISAAGSLLGSASLVSAGDIGIDVGADINATLIDTGGQLTSVAGVGGALEFEYQVPGSITVGTYNLGNANVRILANGDIDFGAINIAGTRNITLIAGNGGGPGDIFLGTATGANNLDLTADNIAFNDLEAAQFLDFLATGSISGGSLTSGSLFTLEGGSINVGDLSSGSLLNVTANAGDVVVGNVISTSVANFDATGSVTAGDVTASGFGTRIDAGTDINVGAITTSGGVADINLVAGGNIDFASISGSRLINLSGIDITGGDVSSSAATIDIEGHSIDVGNVSATGGFVTLESTVGSLNAGDVSSSNLGVRLTSAADLVAGDLSGTGIAIAAAGDASVGDADSVSNLTVNVTGNFTSGLLNADTTSPGMTVTVGGDADILGAATNGLLTMNITGALTGGEMIGASLTRITAASIDIAAAGSRDQSLQVTATAGDAVIGATASNFLTNVTATGAVSVGDATSGTSTTLRGTSVTLDSGTIGGNLTLDATAGDITGTGSITVAAGIALDATGGISVGSLTAQGGNFTASAGDDIIFTAVGASQLVDLQAGGLIRGDILDAGTSATLDASGSITVDHAEAGTDFTATAGGNFTTGLNSIITGGDIVIVGDIVNLGNSTAGGLIDVTGTQIDFVNLIAGSTVDLLTVFNAPSGVTGSGNLNITGTNITAGPGASSLDALGGIALSGTTTIGGSLTMDAVQDIAFQSAEVQNGDFFATAGGSISFGTADASGLIDFLTDGAIAATGLIQSGGGVTLDALGGSVSGTDIVTGGPVDISAASTVTFNDIALDATSVGISADGDVTLNDIVAASSISITSGGALDFNDFEAGTGVSLFSQNAMNGNLIDAGGDVSLDGASVTLSGITAGGDVFGNAETGDFTVATITTPAEIFIIAAGLADLGILSAGTDVTVEGEDIELDEGDAGDAISLTSSAVGGITSGALTAGGTITVSAGADGFAGAALDAGVDILIGAVGAITADGLVAGQNVSVSSSGAGDIALGTVSARQNIDATTDGAFTATSLTASQAGSGEVLVQAQNGITIDSLTGNSAILQSVGGAIAVAGDIDMTGLVSADGTSVLLRSSSNLAANANATGGDIDISVGGDLDMQGATANGNITLASGGSTTVNAFAGATTTLPSGTQGTQQVTTINGGNISITAGTDVIINSDVSASGDLTIDAGNLLDIQAAASGATIETLSSDITIGTAGTLGRSDVTTDILIQTAGDIQLGGAGGTSTGFELDNDEFSRVHSGGDLTIRSLSGAAGPGNITVGDLDVLAAQGNGTPVDGNIGSASGLFLQSEGNVTFLGAATITGATVDSLFAVDAGNQILIDVDSGNIRVEDANAAITGLIGLSAESVIAASASALADIPGLTVEEIDTLLSQNGGTVRDDGYIQGADISFNVSGQVLIQNSGAGTEFDERRGLTANNVTVNSTNPDVGIVLNGVIDGQTGVDALSLVNVPSTFDPSSTINGCLIIDPASCAAIPPVTSGGPNDDNPLRDLIDDQVEDDSPLEGSIVSMVVEFREDPEQQEDPLLDEPVTGAGNEDLWTDDASQCAEDESCEMEPAE